MTQVPPSFRSDYWDRSGLGEHPPSGVSRTRIEFKEDCDLPTIMRRWMRSGQLPSQATRPGWYGDFTNVTDYLSAWNALADAKAAFMTLPAATRAAFGNNPAELLAALDNPSRRDELIRLGIINPPAAPPAEPAAAPAPTPAPSEGS